MLVSATSEGLHSETLPHFLGRGVVGFANPGIGNHGSVGKVALLTSDPYTTLFCRNGMVSLQQVLLSQRFSLLVAIDWFFAMKIVLWP